MNENVQFSNIDLWLAVFSGFAFVGILSLLQYAGKKYLNYSFLLSGFIPLGLYLSYMFADLYGFFLFIVSLISSSAAIFSIFTFSSVTDNLELAAEEIDIPVEQKKIAKKLDAIGKVMTSGSKAYLWLVGAFTFLGFYLLYQNEIDSRFIQESFSLENPHIIIGIFLSIGALFAGIRYLFLKGLRGEEANTWLIFDRDLLRATALGIAGFIFIPAALAILVGAEVYSGFFLGLIVSMVLVTVPGSLFDIKTDSNYSAITERREILSRVKILGAVSLLLVIFLL